MVLTQDQVDFFAANGYLSYGKLLNDDEIAALRTEYDAIFERANAEGTYNDLAKGNAAKEDSAKPKVRMLQIMNVCERSIVFRKLIYDKRIVDILADLMGPNIMLYHDQALFKPAFHGGPVFWHQDNAYWHCRPANLVSCWMTLDAVNRDNGAMQVIPGSHLKPVWHNTSGSTDKLLDIEGGIDTAKAVVVDLPAGGCMFHHCQTLHYTQPNTTPNQRRAFAIHCMQPGTEIDHDGKRVRLQAGFDHPVLRAV